LLGRQAYIGAATNLLASAWHIGLHYLWKWSWSILLVAGAVGAAVWAVLTYAPGGTNRVAAVVLSAAVSSAYHGRCPRDARESIAASRERSVGCRSGCSHRKGGCIYAEQQTQRV
jgi:hypothetical protein